METHEDTLEDDLARYLDSLGREDSYRVDAVLKEGPLEVTQRVFFVGRSGAELGPFVRKYLSAGSGLGGAYEAVLAAQRRGVSLPHLPRIVECYRHDEKNVVVMECVRRETLSERVLRARTPGERLGLLARVFPDLCDAVSELHERLDPPLIHRDLKPENVMVSDSGVTLIDLGIARSFRQGGEQDTMRFGTRSYAPPEQFGFGQTDVRSDVYALGMLLFFCATGREPTAADREGGFAGAGVPEGRRAVISRAAQLDPVARYGSARELRDAFLAADSHAEKSAPSELEPPTFEPPRSSRSDRRPWLERIPGWAGVAWNVAVICVVVLLCVGCVGGFLNPVPSVAGYPPWLMAVSYFVIIPLMSVIGGYLLLDRRRLRRRFPALARLSVHEEKRWGLRVLLGLFVVWVVLLGVGVSS